MTFSVEIAELEALETIGVEFHLRVFEPSACVPRKPGPILGSLGRMPRGVEFYATWPRRPNERWADRLRRVRKLFARKKWFRHAIARAYVRRMEGCGGA
jgi:hypothetical protein